MLGYTNESNPFLDSNLLQPFVWGKKMEKDQYEKPIKGDNNEENKQLKLMSEIEKVRKRRLDRENELEEIERLRTEEQRLRESAQYEGWQRKEEDFHLEQTRERSKIRLVENRERPIDLLAKGILVVEAAERGGEKDACLLQLEDDLRDPVDVVADLSGRRGDLSELAAGIDSYLELDKSRGGTYAQYWRALQIVTAAALRADVQPDPHHSSVAQDVADLLKGKSQRELEDLRRDIEQNLRERSATDLEYWELMHREVCAQTAKAEARAVHRDLLRRQIELLSATQSESRSRLVADKRQRLASSNAAPTSAETAFLAMQRDASAAAAADVEASMDAGDEVHLQAATYSWQDKYRPRKPRYFNRVKTGWDWNKYNQTHYDFDNPPPKVVQGYKFTLFYPDLIDPSKTPRYFVEPCQDGGGEFVIVRFSAGPPYEDVAFKVVNREWDTNRRSGFLSVFERGVLQLHFNFKRAFYRR